MYSIQVPACLQVESWIFLYVLQTLFFVSLLSVIHDNWSKYYNGVISFLFNRFLGLLYSLHLIIIVNLTCVVQLGWHLSLCVVLICYDGALTAPSRQWLNSHCFARCSINDRGGLLPPLPVGLAWSSDAVCTSDDLGVAGQFINQPLHWQQQRIEPDNQALLLYFLHCMTHQY